MCPPRSLSSSTPSFMCLYYFWTLLLPSFSSLHPPSLPLLSPALSWVAVMNVNCCECQIRWNDVYRTLRQGRVRAASHHPSKAESSAGKSNGAPRGLERIRLRARREQWNILWFFSEPSGANHMLHCGFVAMGYTDKDVEKCQSSSCHGHKTTLMLRSKERSKCHQKDIRHVKRLNQFKNNFVRYK